MAIITCIKKVLVPSEKKSSLKLKIFKITRKYDHIIQFTEIFLPFFLSSYQTKQKTNCYVILIYNNNNAVLKKRIKKRKEKKHKFINSFNNNRLI